MVAKDFASPKVLALCMGKRFTFIHKDDPLAGYLLLILVRSNEPRLICPNHTLLGKVLRIALSRSLRGVLPFSLTFALTSLWVGVFKLITVSSSFAWIMACVTRPC